MRKNHELLFHKPIDRWDEALPLGNGMLGCLVWGNGAPLKFSLDRGDLWDYRVAQEVEVPTYTYSRLISLVRDYDEQAILDEFDEFYFRPSPTKLPTGRIELDFGRPADRTEFRLSLREAQAEVRLVFGEREYDVRSFLHAEKHVGMISVAGMAAGALKAGSAVASGLESSSPNANATGMAAGSPDASAARSASATAKASDATDVEQGVALSGLSGSLSAPANIRIVPPPYVDIEAEKTVDGFGRFENNKVSGLGYPAPEFGQDGNVVWYRQRSRDTFEYAIVYAYSVTAEGALEIAYSVVNNKGDQAGNESGGGNKQEGRKEDGSGGENWLEKAKKAVLEALAEGYSANFLAHRAWWDRYWSKSAVSLPDDYFEKIWYLTNYLFGSCSRKGAPPMPLQGVWTADEGLLPPWKGDYHHNLNTQMSYWHYMKANHMEEGEAFLDFLWELRPQAREFARTFYDAPGICLPAMMTLDGRPVGGWAMYSAQITNQIWLCQAFDHYWLYSGDTDFLRDKAYVYFKETEACIRRWLEEGEDGKLRLPVSASPEIFNNSKRAWLTPNSNYDLSLLIYLYESLERLALELGLESEAAQWRETGCRLPGLAVNERHVLMLSPDETLQESHRHPAHCMAIYPLPILDYDQSERDRQMIDATIHDLEILGKGYWTGYSFAWMACLYARQGNGHGAYHHIKMMWEHFCLQNGFHINGDYMNTGLSMFHYRPFTLEGNMGAADALQEMLLQNDRDYVRLFPAIPPAWREERVAFDRFRGGKGLLVSAEWADGRVRHVTFEAEKDVRFALRNDFTSERLIAKQGDRSSELLCPSGKPIELELVAGERCRIEAKQ